MNFPWTLDTKKIHNLFGHVVSHITVIENIIVMVGYKTKQKRERERCVLFLFLQFLRSVAIGSLLRSLWTKWSNMFRLNEPSKNRIQWSEETVEHDWLGWSDSFLKKKAKWTTCKRNRSRNKNSKRKKY